MIISLDLHVLIVHVGDLLKSASSELHVHVDHWRLVWVGSRDNDLHGVLLANLWNLKMTFEHQEVSNWFSRDRYRKIRVSQRSKNTVSTY